MDKTIKVGDFVSVNNTVTESNIIKFSDISGDFNPIHLDEEYAKDSIFKKRIAHGFLVGSYISAVIGQKLPGNGTIYLSQSLYFRAPVFINDQITTTVEVLDFPKPNRVLLKTICVNQEGKIVLEGEAIVIPPVGTILIKD